MSSMLYLSVCFFSVGVGPIPWICVGYIPYTYKALWFGCCLCCTLAIQYVPSHPRKSLYLHFGRLRCVGTDAHLYCRSWLQDFFMFAAINIRGMAVFSVQVNSDVKSQLVSCLSLVSYLKPRGTVWKKSTPYLVPPVLRHARHPLKYKSEKSGRLLGIVPLVQRKSRVTLLSIVLIRQRW